MDYQDILKSQFYNETYKRIANDKKEFPVDHSFKHIEHVLNYARFLSELFKLSDKEKSLLFISAVLHDVGYLDGRKDHAISGAKIAKQFLLKNNFDANDIPVICNAIKNHSGKTKDSFSDKISFCLTLADKLDFARDRYNEKIVNFTNGNNFLEIIKNEVLFEDNFLTIKTYVTSNFDKFKIEQDYFHSKFLNLLKLISEVLGYKTSWEFVII